MNSFSRSSPCPICAGYANLIRGRGERCHGFLSDDRKYAHCSRQEHAGSLVIDSGSGTYAHFLFGQCRCGARHNGERHPKGGRRQHHLTDLGNARRMIEQHGRDLSFCHIWKKWLVWDGARWTADTSGEVERRAKHTVLTIYEEAAAEQDEAKRKALAKWAASSESRSRISAMVDLAKTESGVTLVPERLDGEPWLLNCTNGTVDLRTGQLREHRRDDLCSKLVPVCYDREATCPLFEAFLNRIMDGNLHIIGFLQRAIGYALTGNTREHVFFIWYGTGANGKTTLIEVVRTMLGDYAKTADSSLLLARKGDGVRNDVARLAGARFVSAAETGAGRWLSETLVKQLTGGDTVTARFLYAEFFEFPAQFKLVLATNHKPTIRGTDKGIWRRIRLVPFNVSIPDDEQDKDLPEKLRAELPGILAWAVRGCLRWQTEGLGTPPEITSATESYRQDMDVLGTFIAEQCVQKPGRKTPTSKLYKQYAAWCEEGGEQHLSQREFGLGLTERGFASDRDRKTRYRVGLVLVADVTDSDADFSNPRHVEWHSGNFQKHASQMPSSSEAIAEQDVEVEL